MLCSLTPTKGIGEVNLGKELISIEADLIADLWY